MRDLILERNYIDTVHEVGDLVDAAGAEDVSKRKLSPALAAGQSIVPTPAH
jgi:hypothetical protein